MGKRYSEELQQIPETIKWAADQDVMLLRRAVRLHSDKGLLAVGSGGSFTAAAYAADAHYRVFGRPSQSITPLDAFRVPTGAGPNAAGLLLSAEGKNHDILAAAKQFLIRGCPSIGLTLRSSSPLVDLCEETGSASIATYDMPWGKDGYLATNSLVATLILLWRAYESDLLVGTELPELVGWYSRLARHITLSGDFSPTPRALILHGAAGELGAIDLESKLTEGALAFGQVCNFRQFAHGRHLQLSELSEPISIVSLFASNDPLAEATFRLLPPQATDVLKVQLPRLSDSGSAIAGVLAAMAITQAWAGDRVDPGQPSVPQFGRDLHALDVLRLSPQVQSASAAVLSKRAPDEAAESFLQSALNYIERLSVARIRLLVCDFDGTFCDTVKRFEGLDSKIALEITRLARQGIHLAFATGRGLKLKQVLREKLPSEIWPMVSLGCYSGSVIFNLDDADTPTPLTDPRLLDLKHWLQKTKLLSPSVDPCADAGQLSLRGVSGNEKVRLISAVNEWVAKNGFHGWRTLCSGHSIDVITEKSGKQLVVAELCHRLELDPLTQVLRIGDAGDFGGNDYELLSEGLALSVDTVTPVLNQCWNLLPQMLAGVRGTEYYLRNLDTSNGEAHFSANFVLQAETVVREGIE